MIIKFLMLCLSCVVCCFSDEILVNYHSVNREMFHDIVVGNTIVGVTHQSQSLYMLHFLPDGYCELWKQNRVYPGNWWIEEDLSGIDYVRAFWPEYISAEPGSLFSPENPSFGTATAVRYYIDLNHNTFLIAGKKYRLPVILVPGCPF